MRSSNIIGVDPGINGTIAEIDIDKGEHFRVSDMFMLPDEGARNRGAVNTPVLAQIIFNAYANHVFCRLVAPCPKDDVGGSLVFGHSRGNVEGICAEVYLIGLSSLHKARSNRSTL